MFKPGTIVNTKGGSFICVLPQFEPVSTTTFRGIVVAHPKAKFIGRVANYPCDPTFTISDLDFFATRVCGTTSPLGPYEEGRIKAYKTNPYGWAVPRGYYSEPLHLVIVVDQSFYVPDSFTHFSGIFVDQLLDPDSYSKIKTNIPKELYL